MKCTNCDAKTERGVAEVQRAVGDHGFLGEIAAWTCPTCGEVYYDGEALARFEIAVARALAERGLVSGASFKFMRKTLGMRATELAGLLDVAPETISRWETEERDVDRAAWVALAGLVVDRAEGRDRVIGILRALDAPRKQPKSMRIDLQNKAEHTKLSPPPKRRQKPGG